MSRLMTNCINRDYFGQIYLKEQVYDVLIRTFLTKHSVIISYKFLQTSWSCRVAWLSGAWLVCYSDM